MVVSDEVREAVEQVADVGEAWRRAFGEWQRTVRERDRLVERAERRVAKATGGLSVARWEQLCRRRYLHDMGDARAKATAIRARPAVKAAVVERDRVAAGADARVLAARIVLAQASKTVARYGTVGVAMTGQNLDVVRRFARLPPTAA